MATRFYFHDATSALANLPTAEQSSLTITHSVDAQTVNRTMDQTIGTSQVTKSITTTATATRTNYITRFVSAPLDEAAISANTWTYSFAAKTPSINGNFPVSGNNQAVRITCYVWRPGTGKVANILDGTSAATVDEGTATVERGSTCTFAGAAVSSMQTGDVICFEVIIVFTPGSTLSFTHDYFYDGTTVTTTDGTVTSHASFIETPENLVFESTGTNYTGTVSDTVTISEPSLTAFETYVRVPSTDSTTVTAGTATRTTQAFRVPTTDTVTVGDSSLTAARIKQGTPSTDTTTITDSSLVRMLSATRTPSTDVLTIGETPARMLSAIRLPPADSITVVDSSLIRSRGLLRTPTADTTTISDSSLSRLLSAARTSSDTTTITAGTTTRLYSALRVPSTETVSLSESIASLKTSGALVLVRQVSDKVTVGEGAYSLYVHIPLYIYPTVWIPGSEWFQLSDIIAANPDVLFVCKINVNSGPDTAVNSDYTTGIGILKTGSNANHIKIIGYVFTSYGARLMTDVKTDIDRWQSFYGTDIDGIFLDEMENVAGDEAYYQEITNYIHKDKGMSISWGNPGTAVAESYVKANAVDIFQIAEATDFPTSGAISTATFSGAYAPTKFAIGIHSAASYNSTLIADFYTKAAYIFVTSDEMPTPYDTVSTYLDDLAAQSAAIPKASRVLSATRTPSTDSTTVTAGTTARMLSAIRVPSAETVLSNENLIGGKAYGRIPSLDTITIVDSSLSRLLSATRTPSQDTVATTENNTRMLSASRSPSTDVLVSTENLAGGKVYGRIPSIDTVTIAESALTRLLSAVRNPSDTTGIIENLIRILSAFRVPALDTVTVADAGVPIRTRTLTRSTTADVTTVTDFSLTRLLSALRLVTTDTTTISENLTATKAGTLLRTASDNIAATDGALSRSLSSVRTPSLDIVSIIESSLARMKSALRIPGTDTIAVSDSSLTRALQLSRLVGTDTIVLSESVSSLLTTPGIFVRTVSDTVAIAEASLIRLLQSTRTPTTTDVTAISESLLKTKTLTRTPATDSITVTAGTVTRLRSLLRLPTQDTANIIEASLIRLLSLARSTSDTTVISELQGQILHSRALLETVSITEPLLKRVVTAIRSVETDIVDVTEDLFFQTYHKYVFDSVIVAEQLFRERTILSGPTSYAIPSEVRPLLGNLGSGRTDEQIELAIDAAYDEINTKTNRIPPNEWKDTDHNFGVVKKLTRYIAAKEMAIGIKDFDTTALQTEIDHLFNDLLTYDTTSDTTQDIVGSSPDVTYALNQGGLIWSTRYPNLRKRSSGENDTTINPDT